MAEQLDLASPIVPPNRTSYRVVFLSLDWTNQAIRIVIEGSDGTQVPASYNGVAAVTLMTALNTANLSVSSLQKRILLKLQTDGVLGAGAVTGVPS